MSDETTRPEDDDEVARPDLMAARRSGPMHACARRRQPPAARSRRGRRRRTSKAHGPISPVRLDHENAQNATDAPVTDCPTAAIAGDLGGPGDARAVRSSGVYAPSVLREVGSGVSAAGLAAALVTHPARSTAVGREPRDHLETASAGAEATLRLPRLEQSRRAIAAWFANRPEQLHLRER